MFKYLDQSIYVPCNETEIFPKKCPKCSGELEDDGGCSEGCCDDYKCKSCGYAFRVEMPD